MSASQPLYSSPSNDTRRRSLFAVAAVALMALAAFLVVSKENVASLKVVVSAPTSSSARTIHPAAPMQGRANFVAGEFVRSSVNVQTRGVAPKTVAAAELSETRAAEPNPSHVAASESAQETNPLTWVAGVLSVAALAAAGAVAAVSQKRDQYQDLDTLSIEGSARPRVAMAAVGGAPYGTVQVSQMKDFLNDKGYTLVDIRSPDEVDETGSKHSWSKIPLAAMTDKGPVMNKQFLNLIKQAFPNKMSRIIIACDDGTDRTGMACSMICEKMGYTSVQALEGGINAYIAAFPLSEADKIKWKMSDQDMAGPDLSSLVSGVDMRQASERYDQYY